MDSLYNQSIVVQALQDTLEELTDNSFIRRDVADRIFGEACQAVYREVTQNQDQQATCELTGSLRLYRYRRSIWTMYIRNCVTHVHNSDRVSTLSPLPDRMGGEKFVKIVAADKKLWDKRQQHVK